MIAYVHALSFLFGNTFNLLCLSAETDVFGCVEVEVVL
jgi:hypothetical protein